jgi:glycerol-3-phosphate dehydrogenase (NAD+)
VHNICKQLLGRLHPQARAISLIKGIDVSAKGIQLISALISSTLSIDTSVLMGANIANDVASEAFCETTIGYYNADYGQQFKQLFQTKWFRVSIVQDVAGVELCGALKNIVAVAAGLVDGLGYASNTKAAVIRIGLLEMKKFSEMFYHGVQPETFFESCGVADVITSCMAGRNRKVAEAHAKTGKSFEELEAEMLNGQKLQGTITAKEVYEILHEKQLLDQYVTYR